MATPADLTPDPTTSSLGTLDPTSRALSDTQRNGSITGIGIVLGFSLSFIAQWAFAPGEWRYVSLVVLAIAGTGIVFQLRALFKVLDLPILSVDVHRVVSLRFVRGVALVLAGYAAHVAVGFSIEKWGLPLP